MAFCGAEDRTLRCIKTVSPSRRIQRGGLFGVKGSFSAFLPASLRRVSALASQSPPSKVGASTCAKCVFLRELVNLLFSPSSTRALVSCRYSNEHHQLVRLVSKRVRARSICTCGWVHHDGLHRCLVVKLAPDIDHKGLLQAAAHIHLRARGAGSQSDDGMSMRACKWSPSLHVSE